jgi:hypothetical protein
MRRKPGRPAKRRARSGAPDTRFVQIGCPEPYGARDVPCEKCGLPLFHHQVRFEVLEYDDDYDSYVLHAVTHGRFDPNCHVSLGKKLLHLSGGAFESFKECT